LEGGFPQFKQTILDSTAYMAMGNRWDDDVKNFRQSARVEINQMIESSKNTPKPVKQTKKIKGGC